MIFYAARLSRNIFKFILLTLQSSTPLCPYCNSPGYLVPLKSIVMQLHSADKLIEFNDDDDDALSQDIENRTPSWTCPQWTCITWEWTMMMRMWIVCGHSVHPKEVSLQGVLCINFWNWKINKAKEPERIKEGEGGCRQRIRRFKLIVVFPALSLSLSGEKGCSTLLFMCPGISVAFNAT